MTRRSLVVVSLVLAAVAVAQAQISAYSGALNPFLDDVSATRADRQTAATGGDAAAAAEIPLLDAISVEINGPAARASYAAEMLAASDAATTLAKKLKTETALTASLAAAAAPYRADLDLARTDLAALVAASSGGPGAKAKKRLAKADKALKAAAKAAAKQKPFYVQMKSLAAAAKVLSPSVHDPLLEVHGEPVSVAIDSTGRYVYVAEFGDIFDSGTFHGDIRQMSLQPDGSVSYLRPASVVAGERPYGVVASPTDPYVYVGNSGEATVSQFRVQSDGSLQPLSPAKVTLPVGTGVAAIAIDPGGRFVFTLGYGNGGSPMTSWLIGVDGTLSPVDTDYALDFPTSIAASRVDPSTGGEVIAAGRYRAQGLDPQITAFSIGIDGTVAKHGGWSEPSAYYCLGMAPGGHKFGVRDGDEGGDPMKFSVFEEKSNGLFSKITNDRPTGYGSYSMGVSKTGIAVWVGNTASGTISLFGAGSRIKAPAPYGFGVSPDGRWLVVGNHAGRGHAANIVTVFRVTGSGNLTGP